MFVRTEPLYGRNYEWNVEKVRNIPSCVLSSGRPRVKTCEALSTGKWIGLLYAWFQLVINYKVPKSLLSVVPIGLVKHPDPYPLQSTERVRFKWEHFLKTVRRLLPHEVISTMNSESVWLAIAEIIISRERSQHFLLMGQNSGIEFMSWICMWVCAKE